ncbi:MAG: hypothetical protein JJ863_33260 [Deltaproteobacteria bacterium]|nr:hypothetical protein [Deltaproteobacteria bacterium]
MSCFRPLPLLCALVLTACSIEAVELDGLSCPCADGWVCLESVCVRSDEVPDSGTRDLGFADQGVGEDEGVALADHGVADDLGAPDGGPEGDGGSAEPVDCSPLLRRANTQFCAATRESCSAEAYNMTTCDELCAAAGLVCLEAYDDLNPGCGPNLEAPLTCDDDMRMGYHCLCVRE